MATLSARRALVDELIARHRGRIANTAGDSVLAEFASVLDAVRCAIETQAALQTANEAEPEERRMRFRIGVNVGDVMFKEGDIFGDGVNVAARLEGLVKGGEICVSRGVHDHLRHRGGMVFEDLGEQLVKNIAHPIRAFRLHVGEAASGQDVPAPEETAEASELPAAPAAISELSADNEVALELALWDSVKDGSPAELELLSRAVSGGHFRPARPNTAGCRGALAHGPSSADARGRRCGRSRSCFLEFREGQQSARGTRGLPRATPGWPLRRTGSGTPVLSGDHLACVPTDDRASRCYFHAGRNRVLNCATAVDLID